MSHPPHLPPREEKPPRKMKEFLIFVIATVLLSFAAGIAAAAVAVTWILPPLPASQANFTFFQNNQDNAIDASLTKEEKDAVKLRTIQVFDKRKKLPGEFFEGSALLGEGTLLTLDGWAVLSAPGLTVADLSFLQVIDSQGRVLNVEKLVNEPGTGLTYIDVQGEGFPVFSLLNSPVDEQDSIWMVKQNEFVPTQTVVSFPHSKETVKVLTQLSSRVVSGAPVPGFAVNHKAELVGLVDKNFVLIPAPELSRHLRFLQKNGTIQTKGLPLVGYVAQGVQKDETGQTQSKFGFVITDASKVKSGTANNDILIRIQGKDFNPTTAREDVLNSPDEMTLTLLRQGKAIDVKVKKI